MHHSGHCGQGDHASRIRDDSKLLIGLVGLPGSGKSAIGRRLATRLALPFIDVDEVIEARLGCSIRQHFEREGEASFRDLEETVVEELSASPQGVLATGGGAVLREANRRRLHDRAHVIYLHALPEDLFRRLRHDVKRPLLQVADPLARLREMYGQRDPLYREIAREIVETGSVTLPAVVNRIAAGFGAPGAPVTQAPPPR